jgi:hypothetical protein
MVRRKAWAEHLVVYKKLTTEEPEVVCELGLFCFGEVLADSASEEENQNHRGGNPDWPVEVGVAFKHI